MSYITKEIMYVITVYRSVAHIWLDFIQVCIKGRVSVQGVKSLGGHFACLCRGFEFYEVNGKWK